MPLEPQLRELETITLPTEGDWVRVLKTIGKSHKEETARRTAARARALGFAFPLDAEEPLLLVEGAFCMLSVVIREWSFDEAITIESVRRLDDESKAVIFDRMAELYPEPRTDDERKNLNGAGPSTPAAEPTPLPSLDG